MTPPSEVSMRCWTAQLERADALVFGRVTCEPMVPAWRRPTGPQPDRGTNLNLRPLKVLALI
jgi:hypothetical protein